MANPTTFNYKLPTQRVDGTAINASDIKQVNLGIRPKTGTAGTYPLQVIDTTFTADAGGISHEPLAAFGMLAVGDYIAAAQAVTKDGGVSDWSAESPVFTIEPVKPNPCTAVTVS